MTETHEAQASAAKFEIPAAARDFAQRAVKTAQERAETLNDNAEKATSAIESALSGAAATAAEAARSLQGAIYAEITATLTNVEQISAAKSLAEAAEIHVKYLGERGRVAAARVNTVNEYVANAVQDGANYVGGLIARYASKRVAA